jgi:hypothetical protein
VASIFQRPPRLTSRQLVTVAERRFDDAEALCDIGRNKHANGVQYLGGFVIELLLKAQLVRQFESTSRGRRSDSMSPQERRIWNLFFTHDLTEILDRMPEFEALIAKKGERDGRPYQATLRIICHTWTVYARYSPQTSNIGEARDWLERIRELKEVLK